MSRKEAIEKIRELEAELADERRLATLNGEFLFKAEARIADQRLVESCYDCGGSQVERG